VQVFLVVWLSSPAAAQFAFEKNILGKVDKLSFFVIDSSIAISVISNRIQIDEFANQNTRFIKTSTKEI
jgi:hypothetical protein